VAERRTARRPRRRATGRCGAQAGEAGKGPGVSGGIRTAQTFVRLGLVDKYVLTVHPVALGSGKRVFTGKVGLELIDARTYYVQE
jgi:dihydrofolate reductase